MKFNVYLDDLRDTPEGWRRCSTVEETISVLKSSGAYIDTLSLDNDLGENIPEGYKVLDWLEETIFNDPAFPLPDRIVVHSANPVARKRMETVINKLYGRG